MGGGNGNLRKSTQDLDLNPLIVGMENVSFLELNS